MVRWKSLDLVRLRLWVTSWRPNNISNELYSYLPHELDCVLLLHLSFTTFVHFLPSCFSLSSSPYHHYRSTFHASTLSPGDKIKRAAALSVLSQPLVLPYSHLSVDDLMMAMSPFLSISTLFYVVSSARERREGNFIKNDKDSHFSSYSGFISPASSLLSLPGPQSQNHPVNKREPLNIYEWNLICLPIS